MSWDPNPLVYDPAESGELEADAAEAEARLVERRFQRRRYGTDDFDDSWVYVEEPEPAFDGPNPPLDDPLLEPRGWEGTYRETWPQDGEW